MLPLPIIREVSIVREKRGIWVSSRNLQITPYREKGGVLWNRKKELKKKHTERVSPRFHSF